MYKKSNINKTNKTKEMFGKIVTNVQTLVNNGDYEKFLKFSKNFRNYSFNNQILIFSQFPDATMIAGKSKWQKMKREIVNGAKKIFIIAPIPRKYDKKVTKIQDGEEVETLESYEYNTYRYVYVYDISQTVGEELPLKIQNNDGNDMIYLYEKLKNFSPVPVFEEDLQGGLQGCYSEKSKKIMIKQNLSINDKAATLLHELAHCIYDDFDYKTNKDLSEVFVESIAYIVSDHFSLDTSMCSFNYITQYANGDPKVVIDLGPKIQKCANDFINKLESFENEELQNVA